MRASGRLRSVLVRERDDDQEHDHNEGDRISIKPFPIDVDTHRTALLFAEATTKQKALAAAVPTACQQCAKHSSTLGAPHSRDPNSYLENPEEVRSHSPLVAGIPMPDGDRFGLASSPAAAFASKKSVRAAEQDLQRDDG